MASFREGMFVPQPGEDKEIDPRIVNARLTSEQKDTPAGTIEIPQEWIDRVEKMTDAEFEIFAEWVAEEHTKKRKRRDN